MSTEYNNYTFSCKNKGYIYNNYIYIIVRIKRTKMKLFIKLEILACRMLNESL